jgi:hypothetical protein
MKPEVKINDAGGQFQFWRVPERSMFLKVTKRPYGGLYDETRTNEWLDVNSDNVDITICLYDRSAGRTNECGKN